MILFTGIVLSEDEENFVSGLFDKLPAKDNFSRSRMKPKITLKAPQEFKDVESFKKSLKFIVGNFLPFNAYFPHPKFFRSEKDKNGKQEDRHLVLSSSCKSLREFNAKISSSGGGTDISGVNYHDDDRHYHPHLTIGHIKHQLAPNERKEVKEAINHELELQKDKHFKVLVDRISIFHFIEKEERYEVVDTVIIN